LRDLREIRAIRETPGRLDLLELPDLLDLPELPDLLDLLELPGLQAPREPRERTFRFSSIQRMAPVRVLTTLL
jgi:hypothetical protein